MSGYVAVAAVLGAGVLLALNVLSGLPAGRTFDFGAVEVVAPGSAEIVASSPWLQAIVLAAVVGLAVRRFRLDQEELGSVPTRTIALATVAAIAGSLLASKVLSMQYVLWLLPLVPLLGGRYVGLALALAATTTAVYTDDYAGLWHFSPPMVALLVLRNVGADIGNGVRALRQNQLGTWILDALGGLDETFFLYWEDADYCRRAAAAGWERIYLPTVSVRHAGGRSAASNRASSIRAFHESAYYLYAKHAGPLGRAVAPLARLSLWVRGEMLARRAEKVKGL